MWEPLRSPRPIPHLASRRYLREFVKKASTSHTEMLEVARRIVKEHIRGETFLEALQAYVNVCMSIDEVKAKALGHAAISFVTNGLMQLVAAAWTASMPTVPADVTILKEIAERIKGDADWYWMHPKLLQLHRSIIGRRTTEWFARSLTAKPHHLAQIDLLEKVLGKSLDSQVDELVQALHEYRDYGIKPAIFRNGITSRPEHVWLVTDASDMRQLEIDPLGHHKDFFAWFVLTEEKNIVSLESRIEKVPVAGPGTYFTLVGPEVNGQVGWIMDRLGNFHLDHTRGLIARDVFSNMGKEREFSLLRLMSVIQLYDLTVPIKVVRKLPSLSGGIIRRLFGGSPLQELLHPRLIIPRIKELAENRPGLIEALMRELEEGERVTLRRSIRRHDCIGHVRILPKGRTASPDAMARAEAEGIRLQSNETFVRKHERGVAGVKPIAHIAMRR